MSYGKHKLVEKNGYELLLLQAQSGKERYLTSPTIAFKDGTIVRYILILFKCMPCVENALYGILRLVTTLIVQENQRNSQCNMPYMTILVDGRCPDMYWISGY